METLERPRSSFNDRRGTGQKTKKLVFDFKVGDTRIVERYEQGKSNAYSKSVEEYIGSTVVRRIVLSVGHSTMFNQVFTKEDVGFVNYLHVFVNKFSEGKKQVPIEEVAREFQGAIDAGYVEKVDEDKYALPEKSLEILHPPAPDDA